jgi:hypothetical protein
VDYKLMDDMSHGTEIGWLAFGGLRRHGLQSV